MPETQCPFVFHRGGSHPLKTDKAGTVFIFCDLAKSNAWFRSPDALAWLNGNGKGGSIRSNPGYSSIPEPAFSADNPRQVIESVGANESFVTEAPLGRISCPSCGRAIKSVPGVCECGEDFVIGPDEEDEE